MDTPSTEHHKRGRPKKPAREIRRVEILVEARDLRAIDQEAEDRRMTRGEWIRRAIDSYLSAPA